MNARTAALAAIYNVRINLSSIEDDAFVEELAQEVKELETAVVEKENEALSCVSI
jgi:formiminotetrahydrofolate cyclodeaminase